MLSFFLFICCYFCRDWWIKIHLLINLNFNVGCEQTGCFVAYACTLYVMIKKRYDYEFYDITCYYKKLSYRWQTARRIVLTPKTCTCYQAAAPQLITLPTLYIYTSSPAQRRTVAAAAYGRQSVGNVLLSRAVVSWAVVRCSCFAIKCLVITLVFLLAWDPWFPIYPRSP